MSSAARKGLGAPYARATRLAAAMAALLASFVSSEGLAQTYAEEEVKAAYIYHFGTYVDWSQATDAGMDRITIAVLGDEGVYEQLARYLPGRRIDDRDVRVREILSVEALQDDEILFIGSERNRELDAILAAAQAPGRLIVTDTATGLRPGAAINFRRADDSVRFEIAQAAAAAAGLTLSSRLLASAIRVEGEPDI